MQPDALDTDLNRLFRSLGIGIGIIIIIITLSMWYFLDLFQFVILTGIPGMGSSLSKSYQKSHRTDDRCCVSMQKPVDGVLLLPGWLQACKPS